MPLRKGRAPLQPGQVLRVGQQRGGAALAVQGGVHPGERAGGVLPAQLGQAAQARQEGEVRQGRRRERRAVVHAQAAQPPQPCPWSA